MSSCLSILHAHPGAARDWGHCGAGDRNKESLGHCKDGEGAPCVGRGTLRFGVIMGLGAPQGWEWGHHKAGGRDV